MRWREIFRVFPLHPVFQGLSAILFLGPLFITISQYWVSGFFREDISVAFPDWKPWNWYLSVPVWLIVGIIAIIYLASIFWLMRKRFLGYVALWTLVIIVIDNLSYSLSLYLSGWLDTMGVNHVRSFNKFIFAIEYNALWQELFFRGIPLLILMCISKKWSKTTPWAKWCYIIIPSVLFAGYHIPGHGPGRILDTFIVGVGLAVIAMRYSLGASILILFFNNTISLLDYATRVPKNQTIWLIQNSIWMHPCETMCRYAFIGAIPILILWHWWQLKNQKENLQNISQK